MSLNQCILVVEDDADIALVSKAYLERSNYRVVLAQDGREALSALSAYSPKLVVLDWMLPGLDGLDVLKHIRGYSDAAVIMLSAKQEEEHRILGLEHGADDYLTKPFSPRELVARVKTVLRRTHPNAPHTRTLRRGRLEMQRDYRRAHLDGVALTVTSLEFELLYTLAAQPGLVFERDHLLNLVWGRDYRGFDRVVDVHIYNLRRKLAEIDASCAAMIQTVWRVGYTFVEDEYVEDKA